MRGLHNIRLPQPTSTWRWYSAVQSRRGRRHLIKVPVVAVDLEAFIEDRTGRRRIPYHMRYAGADERAQWARTSMLTGYNLIIPGNVTTNDMDDANDALRLCSTEQAANRYEIVSQPSNHVTERPRGFCERCWRDWPAYKGHFAETIHAQPIGYLRANTEDWETSAKRDYRPYN